MLSMPIFVRRLCHCWNALCVLLLALGVLLSGPFAMAQNPQGQVVDWLYEVDQYVPDQGADNRLEAGQRSLLRVLSRTTGLVSIPRTPAVTQALSQPQRYYGQYVYFSPSAVGSQRRQRIDNAKIANQADLAVRFSFQSEAVKQLVRQAKLPSWWSRRPSTLAWIVLDTAQGREIVDSSQTEMVNVLSREAARRGLPVLIPSMDLQDSLLVSPAVVWGRFTDLLDEASARYQAQYYLVGRFSVQEVLGQRFYTGEWVARSGNTEDSRFLRGVSFEEVARAGVDMAAQRILDRHLVFGNTVSQHDLVVKGIGSLETYAQLLDYFESLEFVDGVTLQEITGDALALRLQSLAGLDQLRQLLVDDGRFQSLEAEAEAGVDIGTGFSELVLPGRQQTKTVLQWRSDT
jgi:hypothetical protein